MGPGTTVTCSWISDPNELIQLARAENEGGGRHGYLSLSFSLRHVYGERVMALAQDAIRQSIRTDLKGLSSRRAEKVCTRNRVAMHCKREKQQEKRGSG